MIRRLALLAPLALAACASDGQTRIQSIEVPVPVAVACVPAGFPAPPAYPDSDAALAQASGAADRYRLIAAGRVLRVQRLAEIEPVLAACR